MAHSLIKPTAALLALALTAAPFGGSAQADGADAKLAALLDPAISVLAASPSAVAFGSSSSEDGSSPESDTAIIDKAIDVASNDTVKVIVQLKGQAVSEARYAAGLARRPFSAESAERAVQTEQQAFKREAGSQGIAMKVNVQYDTVLNGMEVSVKASEIPKLALVSGVKSISKSIDYYPIPLIDPQASGDGSGLNYEIDPLKQIGADLAWTGGFTGKGVKVGVLDTGVDYLHPDLIGAYKGGYDAFYQDDDPYEEPPEIFGYEGTMHGTHVAGTIVGRGQNPDSEIVQKGVAYEADLYAYKVLGKTYNEKKGIYQTSGTSANIIDGIEHAVEDGMDVINMSLGSDLEKGPDAPDSIAVNNAVLAGVTVVIANGNAGQEGKYYYSLGSPASAQLAISVAAATSTSTHVSADFTAQLTDPSSGEAHAVTDTVYSDLIAWNYGERDFAALLGSEPLDAVYVGLGDYGDYDNAGDVTGKIVIASRGNKTFVEKIELAKEKGAKALILFNGNSVNEGPEADLSPNIPGRDGPIGEMAYMADDYAFIPTFDMAGAQGRALAREVLAHPDQQLQIKFGENFATIQKAGDTIAGFSSRGPNSDGNYGIKPDISAPGVNILSSIPEYAALYGNPDYYFEDEPNYAQAYHRSSGTSMASPHIAGLAALLTEAHADWTPRDIRAALANTADVIHDESGTQYDVYSQGSGRADVSRALTTPAVVEAMDAVTVYDTKMNADDIESEASSLSFGAIEPGAEPLTKPLRVKNLSGGSVTYAVRAVMHPSVTSDPSDPIATPDVRNINVELGGLSADASLTADAGSSVPFTLSVQAADNAAHGVYEGEVVLESTGHPSLHLPFVVHVGTDAEDNDFGLINGALSNKRISPDAPADMTVTLNNDKTNMMILEYNNLNEQYIGRAADLYDLDTVNQTLAAIPAGKLLFENLDGSYVDGTVDYFGSTVVKHLPPGQYKINVYAVEYDERFEIKNVEMTKLTFYMLGEDEAGSTEPGLPPAPPPGPPPAPPVYGSGGGGGVAAPVAGQPNATVSAVAKPGQAIVPLAGKAARDGDRTTVTIDSAELRQTLAAAANATMISVVASDQGQGKGVLSLSADQVKLLQTAPGNSAVAFTWNEASVALSISGLDGVAADAGLSVSIAPAAGAGAELTSGYAGTALLGTPYTFEAAVVAGGASSELKLAPDQAIRRAFVLGKEIDVRNAGALYREGGKVYPVPVSFKQLADGSTVATISRPGFSTYGIAARHVAFQDVASSWAKTYIGQLADTFILNGTAADTFSPKSPVTRAQFASMLATAIGLGRDTSGNAFTDIRGTEWYAKDVNAAYEAGLISGYGGSFKPNDTITRQDLTVMLARAIKLLDVKITGGAGHKPYADASAFSSYAADSIQTVSEAGLMQGVEEKGRFFFNPAQPTSREAAAKVLYQLLTAAGLR
ncbi:S8 family serine peptidase [Paenibacillus sp. GCM10023250]|uniref:S8 family serine peptidase n=1 Tax=Paenibacillus sp. GCM10023250 TaxID=3252648 RepID=UPI00361D9EA2